MPPTPSIPPPGTGIRRPLLVLLVSLVVVVGALFHKSFLPDHVLFNNDTPLGAFVGMADDAVGNIREAWLGLNWLGFAQPGGGVRLGHLLFTALGPFFFLKIVAPLSLILLGLSAGYFFRQLKLAPLACVLGGLAAALHSDFLGNACWGQISRPLSLAASFLALGLTENAGGWRGWARIMLAGMVVGWGVMEGFDVGAIFSIFVAIYLVFRSLAGGPGAPVRKLADGVIRVAVVAGFAGFIAVQTIHGLVGTQIINVKGMGQDQKTKTERWDEATMWSLPKKETLALVVPGLFGYRMQGIGPDPGDGSYYWGAIGQTPGWETHHQGNPRFGGGGPYSGVLVVVLALWALCNSFSKSQCAFTATQRRLIWFWAGMALICLLFAYGRHAPFYQFFYALPYASTIRNPVKFIHIFDWCLVVLCAFGAHGLARGYLEKTHATTTNRPGAKGVTPGTAGFDRKWIAGSILLFVLSVVGLLLYAATQSGLQRYLQSVAFDADTTAKIAKFSLRSGAGFVVLLAVALGLVALVMRGRFAGGAARWGAALLGLTLVVDLGRADLPWVLYVNAPVKYATNPVLDRLRDKPEHQRVTIFPLERFVKFDQLPRDLVPLAESYLQLNQLYRIEWTQHHFQYYKIQALDVIQLPRTPEDYAAYETALVRAPLRRWELTNTRFLLAPTALLELFNQQLDPVQKRFRVVLPFDLAAKPGLLDERNLTPLERVTAVANTNGQYALFEFTGALPRAKLYAQWQVITNDQETLSQLAGSAFNPQQTMLVSSPLPGPVATTNPVAASAEIVHYASKSIQLRAKSDIPSVLLLNDHFDPGWQVTVDGKPAELLRCNYIMRGVHLPPGDHPVEFSFAPPTWPFRVSLAATAVGLMLLGVILFCRERHPDRT